MSRTLADMTPAERAACVGMWCEDARADLVVYVRDSRPVESGNIWGDSAVVIGGWHDPANDISRPWLGSLTPRFDLPRAWTPTGEPVDGEWEESASTPSIRRWCARWERKPDEEAHR